MLFRLEDFSLVNKLPERIVKRPELYFLKAGSRCYSPTNNKADDNYLITDDNSLIIQVCVRVRGGKGGFGTRLKAEGQRLSNPKRSGNYAECRDLDGRRLKDVRDAQLIQEYLEREPELKAKAHSERMAYYKNILNGSVEKRKFTKKDEEYEKSRQRAVESVECAVADFDKSKIIKKRTNL
jgi:Silencing defective 2 N-terminal ubiquitin domain